MSDSERPVPVASCHRYFLGFRPEPPLRAFLARLRGDAGQRDHAIRDEHLHLTLCILAEAPERERFTETRISAALARRRPPSCPIRLGRLRAGRGGATLYGTGGQHEVRAFRQALLGLLARRGLEPCRAPLRFQPHVTLGHDAVPPLRSLAPVEWVPRELLLIESEVGRSIHHVRGRWPLEPPAQSVLPFDAPLQPLRAAGNGRR